MATSFSDGTARMLWPLMAACLVLLASCGGGTDASVVRFWALGAEGDNVRPLVQEFERRNPGIRVQVQAIPWTAAHEKLLTAYAGNSMPDLFQLGNTWIPEFRVLRALEDLRPWLEHSAIVREEGYFPGIWSTNVLDSALLGIPWYVDTRVLFYRSDLCAAVGFPQPPRTWDEWFEVARRLRQKAAAEAREAYGIYLPTNEWTPAVILAYQTGATFLRDQWTRGGFREKEFHRAFQFYVSFARNGLAPIGIQQITNIFQGFTEGYFAMYITGPWNIGEFRRRLPPEMEGRWMTAPLPGPRGQYPGLSHAGGSSLVISRSSPRKEAAWKLLEFLSGPEQQLAFYRLTGDLPARREAWEDTLLTGNPYIEAFRLQLNHVAHPPQIPEWEQIAMKIQQYSEFASVGALSLDESLEQLDRDVDVILEKRRWLVHGK